MLAPGCWTRGWWAVSNSSGSESVMPILYTVGEPTSPARTFLCELLAATTTRYTIHRMDATFKLNKNGKLVCFEVPTTEAICCFLQRQRVSHEEQEDDLERDTFTPSLENDEESCFEYGDEAEEWLDDSSDDGDAEATDDEVWIAAGLFGIGRYAQTWWMVGSGLHGDTCTCRPLGLLEVLQDHAEPGNRQGALEAHLGGLRMIWDHFWSGDALVNGSCDLINGACSYCIAEGREHLGDVLDEARNLAEELGVALAAFHTQIDLGRDRYNL